MLELVAQVLAYSGVGLVILVVGYFAIDLLTPGHLGRHVADGNVNASILVGAGLLSLGLIEYYAIHYTGAGWGRLDDALVFGLVGVAVQAVGFVVLNLLTPGKLGEVVTGERFHPATMVSASAQVAVALIVCASLT